MTKNTKNFLFLFAIILNLISCSALDTNRIAPGYVETFKAINNILFGFPEEKINADIINQIPYASILLRIGNGPEGLMILESIENEKHIWVSADGVFIATNKGRIVGTKGLGNNLQKVLHEIDFKASLDIKNRTNSKAYYSYENPNLINLELETSYTVSGIEEVLILDKTRKLTRLDEVIENRYLGWKATNKYWIDKTGYVWKSEQYISPKVPKLVIKVTKKPS